MATYRGGRPAPKSEQNWITSEQRWNKTTEQEKIEKERGDVGNFLNLPYFGGTDNNRYAFLDDGSAATLDEFLDLVTQYRVSKEEFCSDKIKESIETWVGKIEDMEAEFDKIDTKLQEVPKEARQYLMAKRP